MNQSQEATQKQNRQTAHRLWCGLLICLLVPVAGCQSFHPFNRTVQPKLAQAKKWVTGGVDAFHNGQLSKAKTFFSRAAQENPQDPVAQAHLARTLHQDGQTVQAIPYMRRATQLKHDDPRLLVDLGEMYLQSRQWNLAQRQAEQALEIDHRFAPAWALTGKTHLAKGNLSRALADFQHAASIDADLPDLQLLIAQTYQGLDQPLRSLAAAEHLLSRFPPDRQPEPALIVKSVALMSLEQLHPAIEILQTASQRPDASEHVFLKLSQAQIMAGQTSQARLTLTRAKRAFPEKSHFDDLLTELRSPNERVAQASSTLK